MKHLLSRKSVTVLLAATMVGSLFADERTLTPKQMEAIARQGELDGGRNARPASANDPIRPGPPWKNSALCRPEGPMAQSPGLQAWDVGWDMRVAG